MSVKSVVLSEVQSLAAEYVFSELNKGREEYAAVEATAKARFGVILAEIGVDPAQAGTARCTVGPNGAVVEYDAPDGPTVECNLALVED